MIIEDWWPTVAWCSYWLVLQTHRRAKFVSCSSKL